MLIMRRAIILTLASGATIVGDLPPSSRVVDVSVLAAAVATILPTAPLPV